MEGIGSVVERAVRPPLNSRIDADELFSKELLTPLLEGRFGSNGFDVRTNVVELERHCRDFRATAEVLSSIHSNTGNNIGDFHYRLSEYPDGLRSVYIERLKLDNPGQQRGGFGTAFMDHAEASWRALGVTRSRLHAALTVGGHFWPKRGYDFELINPRLLPEVERQARAGQLIDDAYRASRISTSEYERLIAMTRVDPTGPRDAIRGARDIADLPEGKRILLGSNWQAVKQL
jgi:hypothetical protein